MTFRRTFYSLLAALITAAAGLILLTAKVQAAPAAPVDIVITQPDGSQVTLRQWGDEWQNGLETPQGYTVILDESSGYMVYAQQQPDGSLGPALVNGAPLIAGRDEPAGLAPHAYPLAPARPAFPRGAALEPGARAPYQGTVPMLVILANFNNIDGAYTASQFQSMAFGASSSIKDYYATASFDQLDIVPVSESFGTADDGVIGWVELGIDHPNPSSLTFAASSGIARAALTAANPYISYIDYDSDGDGYISSRELLVVIFAAGYEKSYSSSYTPGIWAHQWFLDSAPLTLDGVRVGQNSADGNYGGYTIAGERHGDHRAALGTVTHEVGHLLSWPDLYDIDQSSEGVGEWSIMGSGSWNGVSVPGDSPALPDAFLKWYQGWITPTKALDGLHYSVARSSDHAQAYLLGSNPMMVDWDFTRNRGSGEYWLVENRQLSGYDAGLPGCGLLLWHVNENVSQDNDANANENNPLVGLEQADGLNHLGSGLNRGDGGDPYPGASGNRWFNNSTNPDSKFNGGLPSNVNLTIDNTACQSSMGFTVTALGDSYTYLPVILQWPTVQLSGKVTDNGAAVSGQTIHVMFSTNSGSSYTEIAEVKTNSAGDYTYKLAPTYPNHRYYLYWDNASVNTSWLNYFVCNVVPPTTTGSTCNINLRDIKMVSPGGGATITWPNTFIWARRSTTSDSYQVRIFSSGGTLLAETPFLGYVDRVTMDKAPDYTSVGTQYLWSMYTRTPHGDGDALYWRSIYWSDLSGPALNGQPLAGWGEVVVDEICPAPFNPKEIEP